LKICCTKLGRLKELGETFRYSLDDNLLFAETKGFIDKDQKAWDGTLHESWMKIILLKLKPMFKCADNRFILNYTKDILQYKFKGIS